MNIFDTKFPESTLEYLAIGSMELLGLFEIIDVMTGWVAWFNFASSFSVWTIFVSVPILFVSYFAGLLSVLLAEYLFFTFIKKTPQIVTENYANLGIMNNFMLFHKYSEGLRIVRVLLGATVGFIVLSAGILYQATRQTEGIGLALRITGIGFVVLALICPVFANEVHKQNMLLLNEYSSQSLTKQKQNKKLITRK